MLKRALDKLKTKPEECVDYEMQFRLMPSSVSDVDGQHTAKMPYAVKFLINDKETLSQQLVELERSLRKNEVVYRFTLDGCELCLVGSRVGPYKMKEGSRRYQLLRLLAKAKKSVPTQKLAQFFAVKRVDRIRRTVDEIRKGAAEKLGVPRDAVVKNTPPDGYSAPEVTISESLRGIPR